MTVRLLPPTLVNQIAAGEVIERPYSVIKELVENSIDAGATAIEVVLRDGGRSYMAVIDNGQGMNQKDLSLCIERHATSKLPDENLFCIKTLGFRGEALPSIGSIARLKITSKHRDEDHAWLLRIDGGVKQDLQPASLSQGTHVEVSDLFFATPARLKFLKTPQTEMGYTLDVLRRLAMVNPNISFILRDEKRIIFQCKQTTTDNTGLLKRLSHIMGDDFAQNSFGVALESEEYQLSGFAGLPTLNKANAQHQYLFVNGRSVKDKILNHAVKLSYQDFLARDRFPMVCLYLDIAPELVDMNVHPAKVEVRFRDPGKVRNILTGALKTALQESGFKASTTVADQVYTSIQAGQATEKVAMQPTLSIQNSVPRYQSSGHTNRNNVLAPHRGFSAVPNRSAALPSRQSHFKEGPHFSISEAVQMPEQRPEAENDDFSAYPLGLARAQLHETYVIAESKDGIVIVDQHAVHERIVYERMKEELMKHGIRRQGLLVPEVLNLRPEQQKILLDHAPELEKLGLVIEGFGDNAVIVREVPAVLGNFDVAQAINDIVDELDEMGTSTHLKKTIDSLLGTMACHSSIRAGRKLSVREMNELLRQMEITPHVGQCNHGRPTYVELKKKDIERLFGRT